MRFERTTSSLQGTLSPIEIQTQMVRVRRVELLMLTHLGLNQAPMPIRVYPHIRALLFMYWWKALQNHPQHFLWVVATLAGHIGLEPITLRLWGQMSGLNWLYPKSNSFWCSSAWQFEHNKIHLSVSAINVAIDFVSVREIPKSFSIGSKWWNSNARIHLSYPHFSHFPPRRFINAFLMARRLIVIA